MTPGQVHDSKVALTSKVAEGEDRGVPFLPLVLKNYYLSPLPTPSVSLSLLLANIYKLALWLRPRSDLGLLWWLHM